MFGIRYAVKLPVDIVGPLCWYRSVVKATAATGLVNKNAFTGTGRVIPAKASKRCDVLT